jgi:hypothetical protein
MKEKPAVIGPSLPVDFLDPNTSNDHVDEPSCSFDTQSKFMIKNLFFILFIRVIEIKISIFGITNLPWSPFLTFFFKKFPKFWVKT